MALFFHVTSSLNRSSILANGLDWTRMGLAPGIAGSREPEQEGCFVCLDEWEVEWFLAMNNTGGPVDVWAVEGVEEASLIVSPEGHHYVPRQVVPRHLSMIDQDIEPHGFPTKPWRRR